MSSTEGKLNKSKKTRRKGSIYKMLIDFSSLLSSFAIIFSAIAYFIVIYYNSPPNVSATALLISGGILVFFTTYIACKNNHINTRIIIVCECVITCLFIYLYPYLIHQFLAQLQPQQQKEDIITYFPDKFDDIQKKLNRLIDIQKKLGVDVNLDIDEFKKYHEKIKEQLVTNEFLNGDWSCNIVSYNAIMMNGTFSSYIKQNEISRNTSFKKEGGDLYEIRLNYKEKSTLIDLYDENESFSFKNGVYVEKKGLILRRSDNQFYLVTELILTSEAIEYTSLNKKFKQEFTCFRIIN